MTGIDTARIARISAALVALALMTAKAEARGFHGGMIGPRVGAWGRPVGPIRPGFAFRPHVSHPWRHGPWGYVYGLGGLGLGLGYGGLFGGYGYPWYDDVYVYRPPIDRRPVEVIVETEEPAPDEPAAIAACAHRFKTYDPASRTYVGKGYVRRHCP
ncbi:BA14K family protein [Methylobacterium sp. J-026]|uniref:BA14K family protein n=1 Tax=Methylobacterium sp. J-026 TaxID=2836624 RepID=UPI001FB8B7CE|nr:BA14K family protein [Methylobacterium sp. J-026]MCJ2137936.1 BA14K family protein [Methylobacterium sp. J-026]